MFIVTINPNTAIGRYYGPQLVSDGDRYEITGGYLVVFAAHGPDDGRGRRRSVLVLPIDDLLAIDEV